LYPTIYSIVIALLSNVYHIATPHFAVGRCTNVLERGAFSEFEKYLEMLEPLNTYNKLGAILFELPPFFTISDFSKIEPFLAKLPNDYDYAVEFRHASWQTESALELLGQHNIASVLTDSPDPSLQFLSNPVVTAEHSFIRLNGRNHGFWYNYLYSKDELEPWAKKVNDLATKVKRLRIYFNNHYAGATIINAMQFEEMLGKELSDDKKTMLHHAEQYYMQHMPSKNQIA
jgi:uncharacterized protein YecE (DUF72 family)